MSSSTRLKIFPFNINFKQISVRETQDIPFFHFAVTLKSIQRTSTAVIHMTIFSCDTAVRSIQADKKF